MITLPNGCRASEIKVSPSNWNKAGATTKKPWRIHYRFYDPTFEKSKQFTIKSGINFFSDLKDRRFAVQQIIASLLFKLKEQAYNPITGLSVVPDEMDYEIDPATPFIAAIKQAKEKLKVVEHTRTDIKSVIAGVEKAARQLRFSDLPIEKVSRRHLKMILEQCGKNNERWSPRRYNLYRAYLLMLFKELVELEAVTANPVRDISKRKEFKKLRTVLSEEQRTTIDAHLKEHHYRFWLFVHLFFHSGGRLTELVNIQAKDVDLQNQKYKVVLRKGGLFAEVEKVIKDVAVPYWKAFVEECTADKPYLFGINFTAAAKPMVSDTLTRTWQKKVKNSAKKGGLGIDVDLYSLKHLNTTEVVDLLSAKEAAKMNSHTSTTMVNQVYDIRKKSRDDAALKSLNNKFA